MYGLILQTKNWINQTLISDNSTFAQIEWNYSHSKIGHYIHWKVYKDSEILVGKKWNKNQPVHCLVDRVFANGPGDLGSIAGHVIPKIFKMVLDIYLLNTQQYEVRIKGKVKESRDNSYCQGSPLFALDYGRQLYFTSFILQ